MLVYPVKAVALSWSLKSRNSSWHGVQLMAYPKKMRSMRQLSASSEGR
jgi:hypothetical protein